MDRLRLLQSSSVSPTTSSIDTTMLISMIVCGVVLILIIAVTVFICNRRSAAQVARKKAAQNAELEVKVEGGSELKTVKSTGLKNFIKLENYQKKNKEENLIEHLDKDENTGIEVEKRDSSLLASTTDRRLLDKSEQSFQGEMNLKCSFGLEEAEPCQGNEKNLNISNLEASFRVDLYKVDAQDDKIIELAIPSKSPIFNDVISNKEKTSKDIVAENIMNYTQGNRADFYSEEDGEPEELDEEEAEYNYYLGNVNENINENVNVKDEIVNNKIIELDIENSSEIKLVKTNTQSRYTNGTDLTTKHAEQEMSPEEHSNFYYENDFAEEDEYTRYVNQLNNPKEDNFDELVK